MVNKSFAHIATILSAQFGVHRSHIFSINVFKVKYRATALHHIQPDLQKAIVQRKPKYV
jgi:hypothetical protein